MDTFSKKKVVFFYIPKQCSLITCISGLFITDATYVQHRDCWETVRVETAHCYSLYTRASSILARTTHIPHMNLAISEKLTEIWNSGGGMRLRKWAKAEQCKGIEMERHKHIQ